MPITKEEREYAAKHPNSFVAWMVGFDDAVQKTWNTHKNANGL